MRKSILIVVALIAFASCKAIQPKVLSAEMVVSSHAIYFAVIEQCEGEKCDPLAIDIIDRFGIIENQSILNLTYQPKRFDKIGIKPTDQPGVYEVVRGFGEATYILSLDEFVRRSRSQNLEL